MKRMIHKLEKEVIENSDLLESKINYYE